MGTRKHIHVAEQFVCSYRSECLADEVVGKLAEGFTARTRKHIQMQPGSLYEATD